MRRWRASTGARCEAGAAYAWDDCQYTKNSVMQRSHAGRRVAGLCVGADDCQCTKKLSNAAQPCGAARRSSMAPMTASTQKTQ